MDARSVGRAPEAFVAAGGDPIDILDPDAADLWQIDSRFDGGQHVRFAQFGRVGAQPRGFVDGQADAVMELGIAGVGDGFAGGAVDFAHGRAGAQAVGGALQGLLDDGIGLQCEGRHAGGEDGAGDVAAVAGELGTPIEQQGFPGEDAALAGSVVRAGAVRSAGDDDAGFGKPLAVGTQRPHARFQFVGAFR